MAHRAGAPVRDHALRQLGPRGLGRRPHPRRPGHINLIEDTTGKGHITRNFGPEDRIVLTIPLAEGVVIDGKRTPRTR